MIKQPKIVGKTWFNAKPLKDEDLRGKIVLVDFWTYSCANSLRVLPHLKKWWRKYKDEDFLIIGVHTPEFEFEKEPENIKKAIEDLGIDYPIVLDSDYVNWNNFSNNYWPAKYLADKNGNIVYEYFGEGGYSETEKAIQNLLKGRGSKGEMPKIEKENHIHENVCFIPTPELYCGYSRGKIDNVEGYKYDRVSQYRAPTVLGEDSIALDGKFLAKLDYVEAAQAGSTLFVRFRATEVNLIIAPGDSNAAIRVFWNNLPVPEMIRGKDVDGSDMVRVGKSRMYNLLKNDLMEGVLGIRLEKDKVRAYAFTFSGCYHDKATIPKM